MEYLERTDIAGNTINNQTNKQENIMENQKTSVVDEKTITIPIQVTLTSIAKAMLKEGNLINDIINDSEFDLAVQSILSDNADDHINDWVSSNGSEIADAAKDYIGELVNENIDVSSLASEVRDYIDDGDIVRTQVHDLLAEYVPGNGCSTAKLAAKAIIDTIRYDLITSMREENGATSSYDFTITDSLTRFIDKRIEVRLEQEKELYLKNKQGYMQETAGQLNQPTLTIDQVKTFINSLELYQVTKDRIIEEFNQFHTQQK